VQDQGTGNAALHVKAEAGYHLPQAHAGWRPCELLNLPCMSTPAIYAHGGLSVGTVPSEAPSRSALAFLTCLACGGWWCGIVTPVGSQFPYSDR